ncbi:hypothetical protein [Saccharopolyspora shandongensis]|uniref:hypothetical protein n=1 Tax=Saccharopolyspora shandongensis TaxID=418495 RepID=UPI00340385C4
MVNVEADCLVGPLLAKRARAAGVVYSMAGEVLDGEGGYMVHGKLAPAETSLKLGALPMGLASGVKLCNDIPQGGVVGWDDVEVDDSVLAVQLRRELERTMRG